ncbi:hypothetical protein [Murimonas intestini]|uniref:ABC transporter permease n=1 Tax=Murimonas intestini TaxID=1337051 RepID=A0AB73T6R7_9FIRM|nr:hypothetical protein [Murimonas intestini]MCR1839542.1 hypothetical protein [Murimonas intestini]MCR1866385.1 hypothetical protein [Murimonas intestini]MCR1882497.1 hypothetical protein [Murimonas intestini]
MLGKLLKYEWAATYRLLLMIHGAMIFLALLGRFIFTMFVSAEVPFSLFAGGAYVFIYVLGIVSVSISTTIYLLMRFYKNLFTDEGYLMHTLPVNPGQLIWTKFIIFYIWCFIDVAVLIGCLALFLLTPHSAVIFQNYFSEISAAMVSEFDGSSVKCIAYLSLLIPLSTAVQILMMYFSITLGSLMAKHKVLAAFGSYMAILAGSSTVNMIITTIFWKDYFKVLTDAAMVGNYYTFAGLNATFIPSLITQVILGAVLFKATHYIISKHLNLE